MGVMMPSVSLCKRSDAAFICLTSVCEQLWGYHAALLENRGKGQSRT